MRCEVKNELESTVLSLCNFLFKSKRFHFRQIEEYLGSIVYDASATSTQAQLDCYGFGK